MNVLIISDTNCLIALDNIGQLNLLQALFQQILTSQEVREEFGKALPPWIRVVAVQNQARIQELEASLDKGEASAIALALETANSLLIIDEKKGRKVAQQLNLEFMGTLKVIQLAKERGIIPSLRPIIKDLQAAHGMPCHKAKQAMLEGSAGLAARIRFLPLVGMTVGGSLGYADVIFVELPYSLTSSRSNAERS
jgi:predicted nucleic acid-binding protein